jgi:putative nucleotidyltransferase with HDIG domain
MSQQSSTSASPAPNDYRSRKQALIELFVLLFVTSIIIAITITSLLSDYFQPPAVSSGEVARNSVISTRDFNVSDAAGIHQVRRGEIVVRSGDLVSPLQSLKLQELNKSSGGIAALKNGIGYLILTMLILGGSFAYVSKTWPRKKILKRDLILVGTTLIGSFLFIRLTFALGKITQFSFPDIDSTTCLLLTPLATGGIILQATVGSACLAIFLLSFSLLAGVFLDHSWIVVVTSVLGNAVGALSVRICSRRSAFLTAGIRVALINTAIIGSFILISPEYEANTATFKLLAGVISGLLSGVFATGIIPVVEYFGSYITDVKLLELSSLDRPLLRDLSLQAPGTWNHSMMMGQLGEAAAEAIGANSLLTRVGAYYHDIGKIKKPTYFVENQRDRENKHDKLTPSMSALIIRTHVKDGVELAKQHHLPEQIIGFIPQHHGTALIEYFYDKALKEAPEGDFVDESHYRYPGPKPQSKEAGILMLADGIEASSRLLVDHSQAKIQGLVQKMINKVFASGQLDESELTLRDLHLIAKSFTRVLSGVFHKRIEYAEPVDKYLDKQHESKKEETKIRKLEAVRLKAVDSANKTENPKENEGGESTEKSSQTDPDQTLRRLGL